MRAVNLALAGSWLGLLAGVGMRWPALIVGGLVGFVVVGCVWCVALARGRPP